MFETTIQHQGIKSRRRRHFWVGGAPSPPTKIDRGAPPTQWSRRSALTFYKTSGVARVLGDLVQRFGGGPSEDPFYIRKFLQTTLLHTLADPDLQLREPNVKVWDRAPLWSRDKAPCQKVRRTKSLWSSRHLLISKTNFSSHKFQKFTLKACVGARLRQYIMWVWGTFSLFT